MNLLKKIVGCVFLVYLLFCTDVYSQDTLKQAGKSKIDNNQYNINDLTRGNIREFRDNYIPTEYFPMPEYMVFIDLGVLILLIFTGQYFVLKRKSAHSITVLMIITFVYLGFIRGGCICPVGIITNTTMGIISPDQVGLAELVVFLAPLIIALIAGRIFCSAGCPLGAVQHLSPEKKKQYKLSSGLNKYLRIAPIIILILTIWFAVGRKTFIACELDPYKAIFFTGQAWFEQLLGFIAGRSMETRILFACGIVTWIYLLVIMVIGYYIPRPFCRFICPYGVLLGIVSIFAFRRRRIEFSNCTYCKLCEMVCPTQAIIIDNKAKTGSLSNYDCIECNRCSDICRNKAIC